MSVCGWLSPDGKEHFRCRYGGHADLAVQIMEGLKDVEVVLTAEYTLEGFGWMKIGADGVIETDGDVITHEQFVWVCEHLDMFPKESFVFNFSTFIRRDFIGPEEYRLFERKAKCR